MLVKPFYALAAVGLCVSCNLKAVQVAPAQGREKKPFLWKATSPTATVYLFGSIHVARKEMYPLHASIQEAFAASDTLVVEIDGEKNGQRAAAKKMQAKGMYPTGDSLFKHLDDEVAKLLREYLTERGMAEETITTFKPWMTGLLIMMTEIQRIGLDPELGMDKHFLKQARDKKPIRELETIEEQIDLFDGMSEKIQSLFVKSSIVEGRRMKEQMDDLIEAWSAGDPERMQEKLLESIEEYPDLKPLQHRMFDARNVKMAEKVEGYLKEKGTFFVIAGAGHMVGKKGIVELLKKKAITVKQE